jgi:hypothetical protein
MSVLEWIFVRKYYAPGCGLGVSLRDGDFSNNVFESCRKILQKVPSKIAKPTEKKKNSRDNLLP